MAARRKGLVVSITMRDVAERAGVSVRTVSNVVNERPYVAVETRQRVQQVLDELGYRPNLAARNLRQGRSGMIALVLPELRVPYFTELTEFVIAEAAHYGYTVVVDPTNGDPDRERELVMASDRAMLFDGLIFSPLGLGEADLADRVSRTPMVLLGEYVVDGGFDHVSIDNVAASRAATEHVISLGRTRVAAIGDHPEETTGTAHVRTVGYREALRAAGIDPRPEYSLCPPGFNREGGAQMMTQLLDLDAPPDAVFCYNDLLALGAIRAAHVRGVRVPEDIAIVGFDDIDEGRYSTPTLTTISPDKRALARVAVERLFARMESNADVPKTHTVEFTLIARESTVGT